MKRAQINNVFTILVTLLIIGTIAMLSLRFIQGLSEDKCRTDLIIFERNLQDSIAQGNNYGSSEQKRIAGACGVVELCLVDSNAIGDPTFTSDKQLLSLSVIDGVQTNIFSFDDEGVMRTHGFVSQLDLETPSTPYCLRNTGGYFTLLLQGQGSTTRVS